MTIANLLMVIKCKKNSSFNALKYHLRPLFSLPFFVPNFHVVFMAQMMFGRIMNNAVRHPQTTFPFPKCLIHCCTSKKTSSGYSNTLLCVHKYMLSYTRKLKHSGSQSDFRIAIFLCLFLFASSSAFCFSFFSFVFPV